MVSRPSNGAFESGLTPAAHTANVMFHKTAAIILAGFCTIAGAQDSSLRLAPNGRSIFSPQTGSGLLVQCSRPVPTGISEFWQVSSAQVAELEKKLVPYMAAYAKTHAYGPLLQLTYRRQYVGFVRGGRRLIYGNFYPDGSPSAVCDGGPAFWGIVFDPKTEEFEEPQFNGVA